MVSVCQRGVQLSLLSLCFGAIVLVAPPHATAQSRHSRLSEDLAHKLRGGDYTDTSVIVSGTAAEINDLVARHGLTMKKRLRQGAVLTVKAGRLVDVANDPGVGHLASNHAVFSQMDITNQTIGADQVHRGLVAAGIPGLTGKGIGVAVIDSGVAPVPELRRRIVASLDFTDDRGKGKDEHGHGTHVAGIIAASGHGPYDDTRGVAPDAHIISLKVLDAQGRGLVADVIQAIEWAIDHKERFNIRVMNISLGGPVLQSWRSDPLCQAVERAYRAGIAVVTSAGNLGILKDGTRLSGGVTVPGNSPFAITVGALNAKGTPDLADDVISKYSSRGPTLVDKLPKPEFVAPGTRIRGLLAPGATLAKEFPEFVVRSAGEVRLELSGTSMAAAAVSGAAALLVQGGASQFALRSLLQVTARPVNGESLIAQGAGRVDVAAATTLLATKTSTRNVASGIAYCPQAACRFEMAALFSHVQATSGKDVIIWADRTNSAIIWADARAQAIIWADHSDEAIIWADGADKAIIWADNANAAIIWADSKRTAIIWADQADEAIIWADSVDQAIIWADNADGAIIWAD
jgi:serine protease AprX